MKRLLQSCLLICVFSFGFLLKASGEDQKDTLFLHNGEVLIGNIKSMQLGVITIDSKNINLVNVKISKVRTIGSSSDTMRIETINRAIYYGALKPSKEPGKVYIVTEVREHLVWLSDINSMMPIRKKFFHNLQGNFSAGFSFSHSSSIGQLTFNGKIYYVSKRLELGLSGSSMSSIDTSTFSRDREEVELSTAYNLKEKLYVIFDFDYQRNLELSIARRFQQTLGPGLKFILNSNIQLVTFTGLSVNQELSTAGIRQNWLFELPVGVRFDFFKFSHPNLQFTSSNSFYVGLTQWGRVRYDNSNTLSWEIIHNFSLSLNLYMNYDRRPPDGSGTPKVDYGTVFGVGYKF